MNGNSPHLFRFISLILSPVSGKQQTFTARVTIVESEDNAGIVKMIEEYIIRIMAPTFGYAIVMNKFIKKDDRSYEATKKFTVSSGHSPFKTPEVNGLHNTSTVELQCRGSGHQKFTLLVTGVFIRSADDRLLSGPHVFSQCGKEGVLLLTLKKKNSS